MAAYPGMKPMLQFTNLPPPPGARRRRRRKPVKTPEVPKVRSIPLGPGGTGEGEADDQENLPGPCLKWVSPQFCDELTENGTHLKVNCKVKRKKNPQPLQEVRELFPDTAKNVEKSAVKRNPLEFKRAVDKRSTVRVGKSWSSWSSPDISLYPSTCAPRSKQKLSDVVSETSDDEAMVGEKGGEFYNNEIDGISCNDNQVDDVRVDQLCNKFDNVGWSDNVIAHNDKEKDLDQSLGEDKNDERCRECLSLSDSRKSPATMQPLASLDDHTVPSMCQEQKHREEKEKKEDVKEDKKEEEEDESECDSNSRMMRLRLSNTTQFSQTRNTYSQFEGGKSLICQNNVHQCTTADSQPSCTDKGTACRRALPYECTLSPHRSSPNKECESTSCRRTTPYSYPKFHENSGHAREPGESPLTNQLATSHGGDKMVKSIDYSGCSVEDLSELVKDMSVGDGNDQVTYSRYTSPAPQTSAVFSLAKEKSTSRCTRNFQDSFSQINSVCCNPLLKGFEVSTFKPPVASTPFREHCSSSKVFSSRGEKALVVAYKSPTVACSDRFGTNSNTPLSQQDQEMSILVRETPEHLWCSPRLAATKSDNQGLRKNDKTSFEVAESFIQPVSGSCCSPNSSNKCDGRSHSNRSLPQHLECDEIDDIDMTMFNDFDDTMSRHTSRHDHMETSSQTCPMCSILPPTQDSDLNSEGEWSILAKLTPDDLWCSPVVKLVDNSLDFQ